MWPFGNKQQAAEPPRSSDPTEGPCPQDPSVNHASPEAKFAPSKGNASQSPDKGADKTQEEASNSNESCASKGKDEKAGSAGEESKDKNGDILFRKNLEAEKEFQWLQHVGIPY